MEFFITIFNTFLYQPLFNALIFLYQYLPGQDFGVAVIVLTILVRIILSPLNVQAIKSQKKLADFQPKLEEIKDKHKNDKEKQTKEMMELYKKEKVNPFSGCLPLLIQLPILIALFQIFQGFYGASPEQIIDRVSQILYGFIPHPGVINFMFLGFVDLASRNIVLAIITGIVQYFQTKALTPKIKKTKNKSPDFSRIMQKQTLYLFPVFTVFILLGLPSAVALYWTTTSLFSIGQQYLLFKKDKKIKNNS